MRFRPGVHYPHPPRGPARKPYNMTELALRARRTNLAKVKRARSRSESRVIKLFVWQSRIESGPRPSERALAREVGVWPSYIHKVLRKAHSQGMDALLEHGQRITLDDLAEARRFTARLREAEPGILTQAVQPCAIDEPRALTVDERIAQTWREVAEWKRKNPSYARRRVLFSVPVR